MTTNVTITTIKAERLYSGIASSWDVRVRGAMGVHRNSYVWLDRGTHASHEAADQAAARAARESGAIEVQITEINEPGQFSMPVIMDASRDYGSVPASLQTARVVTIEHANEA